MTYKATACLFGIEVFKQEVTLNQDQLEKHYSYSDVETPQELIDIWNKQPESKITGYKWNYILLPENQQV